MRILVILFFLAPLVGTAQKIHYTDSLNRWLWRTESADGIITWSEVFYLQPDTVVNGMQYRKQAYIFSGTVNVGQLVREDTAIHKVFGRRLSDTAEYLLFDYNLKTGDTLVPHGSIPFVIDHVDSTLINGIFHTRQRFIPAAPVGFCPTFSVTEGMGNDYGMGCVESSVSLICFSNDPANPPVIGAGWGFWNCTLDVSSPPRAQAVSVVPNPVTGQSSILMPYLIDHGKLTVFSQTGQLVYQQDLVAVSQIYPDWSHLSPGVYLYRIQDFNNGASFAGKFLR